MAIQQRIPERTPLNNVEVEYERTGSTRKRRPGFNRARLLDISKDGFELGSREAFRAKEKVRLALHLKGVRDFVKVEGEVEKSSTRITILKQPAFSVVIRFLDPSREQVKKLAWAEEQLAPKRPARAPIRRPEGPEANGAADADSPPAGEVPGPAALRGAAEATPTPEPAGRVQRPVALIELINRLEKFQVTDDLILAVIEAAEAGMDVEVLYPVEMAKESAAEAKEEEEAPEEALPADGEAKPMNVYRLGHRTRIPFSKAGMPIGPPAELVYFSRLKSPEKCFAVELGLDTMTRSSSPSFSRGSILIFATKEPVESGGFAFVKLRTGDEFAQVFFDKNESLRLRRLNPKYPERVVRRNEARMICKLIGHYEDLS